MAVITPNIGTAAYDAQSIVDATDEVAKFLYGQGTGLGLGGDGLVTPNLGTDMNVSVGAWSTAFIGGQLYAWVTTVLSVNPASVTDRKDLVVFSSSTGLGVVPGTPCGTTSWTKLNQPYSNPPPLKPTLPSSSIPLAEIYVPAGCSAIVSNLIVDKAPIGHALVPQSVANTPASGVQLAQASSIANGQMNGTTLLTAASGTPFSVTMVNQLVTGNAHVPAGTYIQSYNSPTSVNLSQATTGGTLTGQSVTFGPVSLVVPANAARVEAWVYNLSVEQVFLGLGSSPSVSSGIFLPPNGGVWPSQGAYTGAVYGICTNNVTGLAAVSFSEV